MPLLAWPGLTGGATPSMIDSLWVQSTGDSGGPSSVTRPTSGRPLPPIVTWDVRRA